MAGYTQAWGTTLLRRLGAPVTPENLRFLNAWSRAEGGAAKNNPFNTTEATPGSVRRPRNSAGVRDYPTPAAGLDATYKTLTNGHYAPILASLRAGRPATETARAVAATPWGTGTGVSRVLGDKTPSKPAPPAQLDAGTPTNPGAAGTPGTVAQPAGLLPFPNPIDGLLGLAGGAAQGAAGAAAGAVVKPVLTFILYGAMTVFGLSGMTLGLVLLALSTKAGKDAAELGVVAAAPEAAPEVAAARQASSSGVPRDPETGMTPAQKASAEHRERTRQDRLTLAQQRRADALAREDRARSERTHVRTQREQSRELDRSARAVSAFGFGHGAGGFDASELDPPRKTFRRTSGQPLPETPPY